MNKFFSYNEIKNTKEAPTTEDIQKLIISDKELKHILDKSKNVLLIEPKWRRSYPPIGLAKIASYVKSIGNTATFARSHIKGDFDCVCISTVFTYNADITLKTINKVKNYYENAEIIVGGIYATLMPEHIIGNIGEGFRLFKGCSDFLDRVPPDYSIDWQLKGAWNDFSFLFTTRGCPNKCAYCAVWRLEPEARIIENWKEHIMENKPKVAVLDNNLSAQPMNHIRKVIQYLKKNNKEVLFGGGLDIKFITDNTAKLLSKLKYCKCGMRIAFDRIEEDGLFQESVERLISAGVSKGSIMAYFLFNFNDTPQEADYRARECLSLGIFPYPQRYTPLNFTTHSKYVGKHWTPALADAFHDFWLRKGMFRNMFFSEFIEKTNKWPLTKEDIRVYKEGKK